MTRTITFDNRARQQTHFTTCYMCACRCGIKVTVESNKVRFIQGNLNHPVNKGVLCAKGSAGIMKQYSAAQAQEAAEAQARQRARRGRFRRDRVGRSAGDTHGASGENPLDESDRARLLHRARPDAGAVRPVGAAVRNTQLVGARRLLLGEHGRGWPLHHRLFFWEFGAPDWEHAKYFVLWGVAEDHSSNPIKIGLDKLKRRGAKIVSINPVRTGYSASPTSGPHSTGHRWLAGAGNRACVAQAWTHRLGVPDPLHQRTVAGRADAGHRWRWIVRARQGRQSDRMGPVGAARGQRSSAGHRAGVVRDGHARRRARREERFFPRHRALSRRSLCSRAGRCRVRCSRGDHPRIAHEMAHVAFNQAVELPIAWTDMHGRKHDKVVGRPVAMYAMRGISAHSNGFHTCRALHLIQMLLGALDGPGNFRARAPYPRRIPIAPCPRTIRRSSSRPTRR